MNTEQTADMAEKIIKEIREGANINSKKSIRKTHFRLRQIIKREQYPEFYFKYVCKILDIPVKVPRKRIKKKSKHVTKS